MSEPKATTTQYKRRYMSVKIYHPFEDFFQDPDGAEGIARRRWRKYAGDNIDEEELWERYRGLSYSYRAKPELDRSEDESEEAITASIKDPTRFSDDKKRNLLLVALFLHRRIPEYLKDNGDVVFTATSTGSVFQALAREISQQEPKLRGTTSKDLVVVYSRIVEMAEKLSRILETDTETGWRGSFRKTVFSEAAEKLANLDRGFRGKKRVLRLEYIGPDAADVIALQEEEEREKLPRTRGRDRRETVGGGSGDHSSNTTITAVVIPTAVVTPTAVEAKEEKAQANRTSKRKRAVKFSVTPPAEPKRAARQDTMYQPQPAAVELSFSSSRQPHHQQAEQEKPQPAAVASLSSSSRQPRHQKAGQEEPQPAAVASSSSSSSRQLHHQQPGQKESQPAIPDEKDDEDGYHESNIGYSDAYNPPDQRTIPLPRSSSLYAHYSGPMPLRTASDSRYVDPHRHKRASVKVIGWGHGRDDRGSRSTALPNPARGPKAYNQGLRRTARSGLPRFNRLQSAMLAFRQDMDAQMVELTATLRDQKAQLSEFHRTAEDILVRFSG